MKQEKMDSEKIHTEILSIIDTYGISGKKASEIMGMSPQMFRNRKSKMKYYNFSSEHLERLKSFFNL